MLYTIGTSNRSAAEFFGDLKGRGISRVIDVRSAPYSRNPEFRSPQVALSAAEYGFSYTWMGDVLGGKSEMPTTDKKFQARADLLLEEAMKRDVAIFCAEGDPKECHRSFKVGADLLLRHGLVVQNILRSGQVEDITKTLLRTAQDVQYTWMPECIRDDVLKLSMQAEGLTEFKVHTPRHRASPQAQKTAQQNLL